MNYQDFVDEIFPFPIRPRKERVTSRVLDEHDHEATRKRFADELARVALDTRSTRIGGDVVFDFTLFGRPFTDLVANYNRRRDDERGARTTASVAVLSKGSPPRVTTFCLRLPRVGSGSDLATAVREVLAETGAPTAQTKYWIDPFYRSGLHIGAEDVDVHPHTFVRWVDHLSIAYRDRFYDELHGMRGAHYSRRRQFD